jgi:hypothetical protein
MKMKACRLEPTNWKQTIWRAVKRRVLDPDLFLVRLTCVVRAELTTAT